MFDIVYEENKECVIIAEEKAYEVKLLELEQVDVTKLFVSVKKG